MFNNLILSAGLLLVSVSSYGQQQSFVEERPILNHHYSISIEGIESMSDEALIKDMKSVLKSIFDVLPSFNPGSGRFELNSPYVFEREKVAYLLETSGLTLLQFEVSSKIEDNELD